MSPEQNFSWRIAALDKDELKQELNLAAVCAYYGIDLRQQGTRLVGRCPFHDDDTPSFTVRRNDKGDEVAGCFGCDFEEGDVFHFLMRQEGCTFPEAVHTARRLLDEGLPEVTTPANGERPAKDFTAEVVNQGHDAKALDAFCETKGIKVAGDWLRDEFGVFARDTGEVVVPHFDAEGEKAPAVKVRSARHDWVPMAERYSRLRELYGVWRDEGHDRVVLCEGESDTWTLAWLLRDEPVDVFGLPSGVDSTPRDEMIERLRGRSVTLLFDADEAGRRGVKLWRSKLPSVKVARLPDGEDATSAGEEAVRKALGTTTPPERHFPAPSPADDEKWSDADHADALAHQHGRHLAYVPETGIWFLCDPETGIWEEDPKEVKARSLMWSGLSASKTKSALYKAQERLQVSREDFRPAENVLHVAGGDVLLLDTGETRKAVPEDFCRSSVGIAYDPAATSPVWDEFLRYVLPDEDVRDWVRRFWGYCLLPGLPREQVALFLHGGPDTGKSTLANVMSATLGSYAISGPKSLLLRTRTERHETQFARLEGKRLVHFNELPSSGQLDENRLKELVSPGQIAARRMYQDFYDIEVTWKLLVTTNNRPLIQDPDDEAVWKRIRAVRMDRSLRDRLQRDPIRDPETGRILDLPRELPSDPAVLSAALAWAVSGLRDWQAGRSLDDCPPAMVLEQLDYRQSQNELEPFFEERVDITAEDLTPPDAATKGALWLAFKIWSDEHDPKGLGQWTRKKYDRKVKALIRQRTGAAEDSELEGRVDSKGERYWRRVRIRVRVPGSVPG